MCGCSLRFDFNDGEKVVFNWDVVCVALDFMCGSVDYECFVCKYLYLFVLVEDGEVEVGLLHVYLELGLFALLLVVRFVVFNCE